MNIRFKPLSASQRIRVLAVLVGAGVIQVAATLLGFAIGIPKPQWMAFPVGLVLWPLAFWYVFVYVRRKADGLPK